MNIIQAVKYMMRVLIPQITPVAGEGIEVAKEKEGSVISATFPGWLPHGEVYVGNSTNAAWAAGTVVALGASAVADPLEDTLAASIPAAGADGQFAVLADDVAASSDGLAAVTGLAVARMSAGFTEAFAAPDGLGGLAGATSGPFRVIYASQSAGEALVAFAGGGGGGGAVSDNTSDIFKIKKSLQNNYTVEVSGGNVILGSNVLQCPSFSGVVTRYGEGYRTNYIILSVAYNSSTQTYTSSLSLAVSPSYPNGLYGFSYTLGKVDFTYDGIHINITNIEQWHYPNHVIITDRWS